MAMSSTWPTVTALFILGVTTLLLTVRPLAGHLAEKEGSYSNVTSIHGLQRRLRQAHYAPILLYYYYYDYYDD